MKKILENGGTAVSIGQAAHAVGVTVSGWLCKFGFCFCSWFAVAVLGVVGLAVLGLAVTPFMT